MYVQLPCRTLGLHGNKLQTNRVYSDPAVILVTIFPPCSANIHLVWTDDNTHAVQYWIHGLYHHIFKNSNKLSSYIGVVAYC